MIRVRRRRHVRTPKLGTKLIVIQVFAVALASIGAKLVRYVASMTTKRQLRDYLTREEVRFSLLHDPRVDRDEQRQRDVELVGVCFAARGDEISRPGGRSCGG